MGVCRCTDGEASSEYAHGGGGQLQESRLHPYIYGWLLVQIPGSSGIIEEGGRVGLRRMASGNIKTCGTKVSEIYRGSALAVLAVGFSSSKSCWSPWQIQRLGTMTLPTVYRGNSY